MRNKQTKIVATISDRNCDVKLLKRLYASGMDVVRINTAHQEVEDTLKVVKNVRAVSDTIGILVDIKGPEVRTSEVEEDIAVKKGERIRIQSGSGFSTKNVLFVSYKHFARDVPKGAAVLLDDGALELKIVEKKKDALVAVFENSGFLQSRKSVNVPDVHLKLASLTKKDKTYIEFSKKHNIDFIAQSFVRNRADVLATKRLLKGTPIGIIAKIENREGVENIDEILDEVYGIMVARGDLGIEIPAQEVPLIQKDLVNKSIARSKPPIVATQMLQSMIEHPRPTRAEVSDVANAILDGTSAVMLSGETAYGKYPVLAVEMMSKIAKQIEAKKAKFKYAAMKQETSDVREQMARSAIVMSSELAIKAIIVPSASGKTARYLAAFRGKVPIYAQCYDGRVMRQLSLSYGIRSGKLEKVKTTDALVKRAVKKLLKYEVLKNDDLVMVIGSTPGTVEQGTNFIEINTVKNCIALKK